ncbi:hypothetical protein C4553_01380 [Candidatus Parcubacteria bacterium]|nr:MAG: hypothetical protein C4553_01380 [Candidatus Parcubacteria bacterium]
MEQHLVGGIVAGIVVLATTWWLGKKIKPDDDASFPVCPECGDNQVTYRVEKPTDPKICQVHGSF